MERLQKKSRARRYLRKMVRVMLWAILFTLVALFLGYYLDTPVPQEIPEKWKVKLIDASMRTYGHLINGLVRMGITTHFSSLDRKISDWFILTQMTGQPWGMSLTAEQTLKVNDTIIDGVRVKVYEPFSTIRSADRAVFVFMHGGGWSTLSVDSYDPLIRKIAKESGVVIYSVDYRLSPQHPYPAPLNDCTKVLNFITENADELRIDPFRVAVGGDSAGGNMAASLSLRFKEKIAMQFLIVPCLQILNFKTTSFIENTVYFRESINNPLSVVFLLNYLGLSTEHLDDFLENNHTSQALKKSLFAGYVNQSRWMRAEYIRDPKLKKGMKQTKRTFGNEALSNQIESKLTDPFIAPLMANESLLRGLPEAYIVTAGYDFIRDDGVMYAERLKATRNKVVHKHYEDGFHHAWFFPHGPLKISVAERMVKDLVHALSTRL